MASKLKPMPPISEEMETRSSDRQDTMFGQKRNAKSRKWSIESDSSEDVQEQKLNANRKWSLSSGELELHEATLPKKPVRNTPRKDKWSIPSSTDSDDDPSRHYPQVQVASVSKPSRFNLPSDSEEEEDPYELAKSPTSSVSSAAPPLPPPVSTIPKSALPTRSAGKFLRRLSRPVDNSVISGCVLSCIISSLLW